MAKARVHAVGKSESIYQIARRYRMDAETIWKAPENDKLREIRKNPDLLALGDPLHIPPREEEGEECATEEHHVFEAETHKVYLRLQIMEEDRETPISDTEYELEIPGEKKPRTGKTGKKGEIEEEIPPGTERAALTVFSSRPIYRELLVGDLDPLLEETPDDPNKGCVRGIQQRLRNLGFGVGEATGKMNDRTRAAIRKFRKRFGLSESDGGDEEFQRKLEEIHDQWT